LDHSTSLQLLSVDIGNIASDKYFIGR